MSNDMPPRPSRLELVCAVVIAGIAVACIGLMIVADWPL